jgi:hypothetical protein
MMRSSALRALVVASIAVALVAGASYLLFHSPASRTVSPGPQSCSLPQPNTSWGYWAVYYTNNDSIASVGGDSNSSLGPVNLSANESIVNLTSQPSIAYAMMCAAAGDTLGQWHYDPSTGLPEKS